MMYTNVDLNRGLRNPNYDTEPEDFLGSKDYPGNRRCVRGRGGEKEKE